MYIYIYTLYFPAFHLCPMDFEASHLFSFPKHVMSVPWKIPRRSLMASPFTAATSTSEDAWPPSSGTPGREAFGAMLHRKLWGIYGNLWE